MSRPQKIHKPINANLNEVLAAVGMGFGKGKQAARKLAKEKGGVNPPVPSVPKPKDS